MAYALRAEYQRRFTKTCTIQFTSEFPLAQPATLSTIEHVLQSPSSPNNAITGPFKARIISTPHLFLPYAHEISNISNIFLNTLDSKRKHTRRPTSSASFYTCLGCMGSGLHKRPCSVRKRFCPRREQSRYDTSFRQKFEHLQLTQVLLETPLKHSSLYSPNQTHNLPSPYWTLLIIIFKYNRVFKMICNVF